MTAHFIIKNIGNLLMCSEYPVLFKKGQDMSVIPSFANAWLKVSDGIIEDYGSMDKFETKNIHVIDAEGALVLPAFVDCHTHLVFAETRELEFVDRIRGLTYQEISARGGGILNSALKLAAMSEEELFQKSKVRLEYAMNLGTGCIEIKSGYGLSFDQEIKILRVIKRLKEELKIPIRATFLGAHSYPLEYRNNHQGYLNILLDEMLPYIAEHKLADYCDVFCEQGFFSPEETDLILKAASQYGIKPRIHTNQFTHSGGIGIALKHQAISVDHLEVLDDSEISQLLNVRTIPVGLPAAAFFMNLEYPPARKMIESGLGLAIATDYNPGTSPCPDPTLTFALSCIKMRLLPEEVLTAMTINAACALEFQDIVGSIEKGKLAQLIIAKPGVSLAQIPYGISSNWINRVILGRA
jgi:imidazolonepropionase